MSNKEFYVRHGLVVNNTVLTANVITNKVGIGTNNAAYTLDVIGNANISQPSLFVAGTNVLATLNSAYTITNAAYDSANSNWAVQNSLYTLANTIYDSANSNWTVQNAIYDLTNTVYNSSNSNWVVQNLVYETVNASYTLANAAYSNANSVAISVNAWANAVGTAGNNYASILAANNALAGNNYTDSVGLAANNYASILAANNALAGNNYTNTVGEAGNNYASILAANNALAGNNYTNTVGAAGNNYASILAANNAIGANTWANTKLANTNNVWTAGSFNIAQDLFVNRNITNVTQLIFNTGTNITPTTPGALTWSQDDSTLHFDMDTPSNVIQHIGQDTFYLVKNQTGETISKGTVVRFAGTLGASGRLLISKATANNSIPSKYVMGVAAADIGNGADGFVYSFGKLRGIDTSMFSAGDILYLSSSVPGAFSNVMPSAPNNKVTVAAVVHSDATVGSIAIRLTYGSRLNENENAEVNGVANGDVLRYNSTNSRFENFNENSLGGAINAVAAFAHSNSVAIAANAWSNTVGIAGNNYTNTVGLSGNNYAGFMVNSSNSYADSTYLKLVSPSQTITGDLSITGNVFLLGNATSIAANNLSINDSLIYLAANNYQSDILDIGFVGHYSNGTANLHTGLFRDHDTKQYFLFNDLGGPEPSTLNDLVPYANGMINAVLHADIITSNIVLGGANAIHTISGAFDKANAAYNNANVGFAAANTYSDSVGLAGNNYTNAVGTAGNNYMLYVTTSGNTYAGYMANSANAYAYDVGVAGNNVTYAVGLAGNSYTQQVGTAGNNYTNAVGLAGNNYASILAANNAVGANAWANTVGVAGNNYTNYVGLSSNSYAEQVGTVGNNYTNTVGVSSNSYSQQVGTAGNNYTNAVGVAGNNYASILAANNAIGANAWANTVGVAGNSYALTTATDIGIAGNNYTNAVGLAGNNYTNAVGVSGNTYTDAVGLAGNNYTNAVGLAGNNYLSILAANNAAGANAWSNTVGTAGNNYATSIGTAGNNYTNAVGTAGNNYTNAVGTAGNSYALTTATDIGIAGNNYASILAANNALAGNNYSNSVGLAGNNYTNSVGSSGNSYALTTATDIGIAGNNYTNSVGEAGNNYASILAANNAAAGNNYTNSVGTAGNNYTNAVGVSGNSYAEQVGAAANAYTSATYYAKSGGLISGDVGISGNLTISGEVTYANTQQLQVGDNIITLNADLPLTTPPVDNAGLEVNRGSLSSNAALLWIESTGQWSITGNNAQTISTFIASNTQLEAYAIAGNSYTQQVGTAGNNYTNSVGAAGNNYATATFATLSNVATVYNTSNMAFNTANAAYAAANNVAPQVTPSYNTANAAFVHANAAYDTSNSNWTVQNALYTTANAGYDTTNAAFAKANNALANATGTFAGNLTISGSATSNNGILSLHDYRGSFSDGIVVDYVNGSGRISVGANDALTFYNHGVGNIPILTLTEYGFVGIGTTNPTYPVTIIANGATTTTLAGAIFSAEGSENGTVQLNIRNAGTSPASSGDLIVTADDGTDVSNYIDLGINGSNYAQAGWTINGARDGYLYSSNTNLAIGTANTTAYKSVSFFVGGTLAGNEVLRIQDSLNGANVGIGRTDPSYKLDVLGTINASNILLNGAPITAGGGASVNVGASAPVSPTVGNLWWDTNSARMYIYYTDADSSQWVDASPASSYLPNTSVTPATYGGATQIPVIVVDAQGRINVAANVAVQGMDYAYANSVVEAANNWANTKVDSITSNGTRIWANSTVTSGIEVVNIDLATTSVTAASYGSSTNIPVITVDTYGRVTYAANIAVQGMDYAYANNIANSTNAWANTKTSGGAYVGNNGELGSGFGDIFRVHSNTLSTNAYVNTGNNAIAAGPITIAVGQTLTINAGASVVIV